MRIKYTISAASLVLLALPACERHASASAMQRDVAGAETAYHVAVTAAEGEHRIAMEKCEAMSGSARVACREQADADLEAAKEEARARQTSPG